MVFPRHGMHLPQAWTQERSILHLKNFGLVVHKKNQGSVQKRNPKRSMMIKPSQQVQGFQEEKEVWLQEETKSRERYVKNTMLQLSKIWSLQESLSRAKEKEGNTWSISCRRKGTLKESQVGQNKLLLLRQGNKTLHSSCTYHVLHIYFLENNMFKEKLYLWKNNKIRIAITMTTS